MESIKNLGRVALKHYVAIEGRVRVIVFDEKEGKDVAEVWWDDGGKSKCPVDRLIALNFYQQDRYPWEKPDKLEKPSPEDVQDSEN